MTTFEAVFLGAFQGIAEFLPISSSAHLQIISQTFKIKEADPAFFILLHAATAFSIITYFFQLTISIQVKSYLKYLSLASLPLLLIAVNKSFFLKAFSSPSLVIGGFFLTAIFLIVVDLLPKKERPLNSWRSLFIGCMQAFAVLPGVSRSGITIFAGSVCKMTAKESVAFSLFLGVIASLGAFALELFEGSKAFSLNFQAFLAFLSAYAAGLFSIRLLLWLVEKRQLKWIGFYLLFLAALKAFVI